MAGLGEVGGLGTLCMALVLALVALAVCWGVVLVARWVSLPALCGSAIAMGRALAALCLRLLSVLLRLLLVGSLVLALFICWPCLGA